MKSKTDELVNRWIEGDLEPEEAETLRQMLTDDASARRSCYELMLLDQMLAGRRESPGLCPLEMAGPAPRRKTRFPRAAWAAVAALAAMIVAGFWIAGGPDDKNPPGTASPQITASSDSRITIAQREDRSQWKPGELLRLERGTAAIRLGNGILAHLEGPAAIELANPGGDIRLFEGRGSFQVDPGGPRFALEIPGGIVRGSDSRFVCLISPDQAALLEIDSGKVEITSHAGRGPVTVQAGEAVRLDVNGAVTSTARPGRTFRSGLPQEIDLYRDDFDSAEGTPLAEHVPQIGGKWEVLEELNQTVILDKKLDTSAGARRLLARLAPHDPGSTGSVYVFSFSLVPPSWTHDKVSRLDGIESIAIVDAHGRELFQLVAEAVNTHRWQLRGGGQSSPLTPVCALWDHQLTVCYGLDGRVTLHDGASAQAPVIASLWIKEPSAAGGILISNRTGGDLAFRKIGTSLLRVPMVRVE